MGLETPVFSSAELGQGVHAVGRRLPRFEGDLDQVAGMIEVVVTEADPQRYSLRVGGQQWEWCYDHRYRSGVVYPAIHEGVGAIWLSLDDASVGRGQMASLAAAYMLWHTVEPVSGVKQARAVLVLPG